MSLVFSTVCPLCGVHVERLTGDGAVLWSERRKSYMSHVRAAHPDASDRDRSLAADDMMRVEIEEFRKDEATT